MVGQIIAILRRNPLIKDLEVIEAITEESVQFLRARVEIVDGSLLRVREAIFPDHSKYSYHWQTRTGDAFIRWDNAPHHPEIPTHPNHKHEGNRVVSSSRVSVEEVLVEVAETLKKKRKNPINWYVSTGGSHEG